MPDDRRTNDRGAFVQPNSGRPGAARASGASSVASSSPVGVSVSIKSSRMRRRSQTRATSTWRALAPWLLTLAGLVVAGSYFWIPASVSDTQLLTNRYALPVDSDPVAQFTDTKVGHVLFMQPDGRHCRRVLFDNQTGGMNLVGDIECVQQESPSGPPAGGRINAIRESFRR